MKVPARGNLVALVSLMLSIPMLAQTNLTWSSPASHTQISDIGGDSGRNGVATTSFLGKIWLAYTSTSNCTVNPGGHVDCPIELSNNGGGSGTNFLGPTRIYTSSFSEGYLVSAANPALAAVNGKMWVAFKDSYGVNYLYYTSDGVNWQFPTGGNYTGVSTSGAAYSPTLAVNPSDAAHLYVALMSGSTYRPILCTANISNPSAFSGNCQSPSTLRTMNFQPGMALFQGLLYMGFEDRGDSHCLYYDVYNPTTNGFGFWNPKNGCPEQTSSAPGEGVHNGQLYTGVRSNDSSQKFNVDVTTNGANFNRVSNGFSLDGPPALLDLGGGGLLAAYSRSHILYTSIGQ